MGILLWVVLGLIWMTIGFFVVRARRQGWLAMMSDDRNVRFVWLVFPALFLTWLLWPFPKVPMYCFLTVNALGL